MRYWQTADTLIVRNIARSDGTVTTAIPTIVICDDAELLAVYIPRGTPFKNNWVIPPARRANSVDAITPSAQRQYRNLVYQRNEIRLYLPGQAYSIGLIVDEHDAFTAWYGNLEAPFIRTSLGIDTRDYALDVIAYPSGQWQWKDEAEFTRRREVGIDSAEHQVRVRAAGWEFIARFERGAWPFNAGWQQWQAPTDWQVRQLPPDWAIDLGSHALLSSNQ